jgi:hypothetical protein
VEWGGAEVDQDWRWVGATVLDFGIFFGNVTPF